MKQKMGPKPTFRFNALSKELLLATTGKLIGARQCMMRRTIGVIIDVKISSSMSMTKLSADAFNTNSATSNSRASINEPDTPSTMATSATSRRHANSTGFAY